MFNGLLCDKATSSLLSEPLLKLTWTWSVWGLSPLYGLQESDTDGFHICLFQIIYLTFLSWASLISFWAIWVPWSTPKIPISKASPVLWSLTFFWWALSPHIPQFLTPWNWEEISCQVCSAIGLAPLLAATGAEDS